MPFCYSLALYVTFDKVNSFYVCNTGIVAVLCSILVNVNLPCNPFNGSLELVTHVFGA